MQMAVESTWHFPIQQREINGLWAFSQMSRTIFSVWALPKGRFSVAQHRSPLLLLKVAAHLHLVQRSTCCQNSIPRAKLLSYNEITFRRDYKNDLAALSQLLLSNPVIVGFGMYLDISASLSLDVPSHILPQQQTMLYG
jgi:hypothetical protein